MAIGPTLDRCRIEATEGLVDKGGEGRLKSWGVLTGVVDVGGELVSATLGDCRGDWIGGRLGEDSITSGGRSGVRARPGSSFSSSGTGCSISKADEFASLKLSSRVARTGEGGR